MAGLFDDKSFKVQPVMGKKAMNRLNKRNSFRMPPNLKGLPSAPKGGLAGAWTMGQKVKKFAEGGLAEGSFEGMDDLALRNMDDEAAAMELGEQNGYTSASGGLDGATPSPTDEDAINERLNSGLSKLANQRLQEAQNQYMTQAQQTLQGMQAPKDTSALAFFANMGGSGGFAQALRNAAGGYQKAQSDYQTQLQNFNNLKAKLGLEVAGNPLEFAYKDLEQTQRAEDREAQRQAIKEYRDEQLALRKAELDVKNKEADTKGDELKADDKKLITKFATDSATGRDAKIKFTKAINSLDKVYTGVLGATDVSKGLQNLMNPDEYAAVDGALGLIQALGAKISAGTGSISNYERALFAAASGAGWDKSPAQNKAIFERAIKVAELETKKNDAWQKAKRTGMKPSEFASEYESNYGDIDEESGSEMPVDKYEKRAEKATAGTPDFSGFKVLRKKPSTGE